MVLREDVLELGILKEWVSKQPFPVFTTNKVASSDLQVMWATLLKPNMWKIDIIKDKDGDEIL